MGKVKAMSRMFIGYFACCFEFINIQRTTRKSWSLAQVSLNFTFEPKFHLNSIFRRAGHLGVLFQGLPLPMAALTPRGAGMAVTAVTILGTQETLAQHWHCRVRLLTAGCTQQLWFVSSQHFKDQVHFV